MTRTTLLTAMLLVLAVVGGAATAPAAMASGDVYAVDGDTRLMSAEATQTFNETGNVTADVGSLAMQVTVAETASAVGLDDTFRASATHTYIRVQYNESIARNVRIYIPEEMLVPRAVDDSKSVTGQATVTMTPSDDREYTAVTFHLDGKTDAVFAVSNLRGAWSSGRSFTDRVLNSTIGVKIPSFSTNVRWQYVDESALTGNDTTHSLQTDGKPLSIQYDTNPAANETTFLPVSRCAETEASLCKFKKQGQPNTVYLLSKSSDPPEVRYKQGSDPMAFGHAIVDDLTSIDDRIMDDLNDWFGGED